MSGSTESALTASTSLSIEIYTVVVFGCSSTPSDMYVPKVEVFTDKKEAYDYYYSHRPEYYDGMEDDDDCYETATRYPLDTGECVIQDSGYHGGEGNRAKRPTGALIKMSRVNIPIETAPLPTVPEKVKIKALLEISDHDGYCSGNDCEYSCSVKQYIIDVPKDSGDNIRDIDWTKYLPIPDINTGGSFYCDLSTDCVKYGLDKHGYKYTILEVEVRGPI